MFDNRIRFLFVAYSIERWNWNIELKIYEILMILKIYNI